MINQLEWFGGDVRALEICNKLAMVSHVWDDVIDEKEVSKQDISEAFKICLIDLPSNELFREVYPLLYPIFVTAIAAWETSNKMEETGEEKNIEMSHGLRFALGHAFIFLSIYVIGYEKASKYMVDMWNDIIPERFGPYLQEHRKEQNG